MVDPLFEFTVPPRLIAQEPIEPRDHARLLVVGRRDQGLAHRHFFDLPDLLRPGDLLVLNDTRVLYARLVGRRATTGGQWQGLFLGAGPDGTWELLSQTRGHLRPGETIVIEPGPLKLKLLSKLPDGRWQAEPSVPGPAAQVLDQTGGVPLPPYIRKGVASERDRERYQTIFARKEGAVAAPTAGLHFTAGIFERLEKRGISWTFVTLHVGLGTFQPMQTMDPARHVMHEEWGELSGYAARAITRCQADGGRIVAVGTTSVRVLETVARGGSIRPWSGMTNLFIHEPFDFRAVDALITNFHFPKTTLLHLAAAFAGEPLLEKAYRAAMDEQYRFFSYGDAMLIE
jgi:S-adenosylmethionine:tRNA ribosyltransferase-isomerase